MNKKRLFSLLVFSLCLNILLGFKFYKSQKIKKSVKKKYKTSRLIKVVENPIRKIERTPSHIEVEKKENPEPEESRDDIVIDQREIILAWEQEREDFFFNELEFEEDVLNIYLSLKDEAARAINELWESEVPDDEGLPKQNTILEINTIKSQYVQQVKNLLGPKKFQALVNKLDQFNEDNQKRYSENSLFLSI